MSRVNHKRVRQLLNEKKSKITDRQFFSSRILAGHFEDLAAAQTKRYHYNRRVRVILSWKPKDNNLAWTDNLSIHINAGHPSVTKVRGRENRYQIILGLFAHELGHVLYTDFLAGQSYANSLALGRWFPAPPKLVSPDDIRNEADFWAYLKADPKSLEMVQFLSHHISNVLEDGYIESRMLVQFPGSLGYALTELRNDHFQDMPTVTQLIEQEGAKQRHIFESILQIMLSYAKYGEIRYGEEPLSDERIQTVFGLLPDIDRALMTHSGKERLEAASMILIRCWKYIREFVELCKERLEEAASSGASTGTAETLAELLQALAGSSSLGEGTTAPVADTDADSTASATAAMRAKTKADAEEAAKEQDKDSTGPGETEGSTAEAAESEAGVSSAEEFPQTEPEKESNNSDNTSDLSESGEISQSESQSEGGKQAASQSEQGRIPLQQTEDCSEPVGGTTEYTEDYQRELDEHAASDIERVLEQMAERAACQQLENERLQELNDAAQSISYGDIHQGVHIRVNRIDSVDDDLVDQFNQVSAPLLTISRQLQRSLVRQLKEERRGGKQTGLLVGRRLDSHALHRTDGKVFYKNALPNEIPELAVGLLLDESGSMCSMERCTYARASAIILYDFCQALNIPVMVYGHSTGYSSSGGTVELYSYAEFDSIDRDDRYRMMDIAARQSNRDGAALRFVAEQLSKRPEGIKLLILVSDGQPADSGYYGTAAEEDLRGIKQEYKRKGILFVAAAIGDDKPSIERIYGDSFLDITDLNQLPAKLTAVVKRFVRA